MARTKTQSSDPKRRPPGAKSVNGVVVNTATSTPPSAQPKAARKAKSKGPRGFHPKTGTIRKARRAKPGVVAQREIEKAMASTNLILPKSNFEALVREIMHNVSTKNQDMPLRCAKDAFEALQEVAEAYIVSVFQSLNALAGHAKRETLMPMDMDTLCSIAHQFPGPSTAPLIQYKPKPSPSMS